MRRGIGAGLALAAALLGASGLDARGQGQVIERKTEVTGPRGRTIERDVRVQRGSGYIDRQIDIRRPGGEIRRDTRVLTGPPGGGHPRGGPAFAGGGGGGWGPRPWGPRPGVIIERDVIFAPPPPPPRPFGFLAVGGPLFGLSLGAPALIAPPPVFVTPPPVIVAPAPPVQVAAPTIDPVAEALGQLQGFWVSNRREAALALGRLNDPRAVPSIMERLKNDSDKTVRAACAWSLGEIGDPRAASYLEHATLYDKRQEVRDAAGLAYQRLPQVTTTTPAPAAPTGGAVAGVQSAPPALEPPAEELPPADLAPIDRDTPPPPPRPAEETGFRDTP